MWQCVLVKLGGKCAVSTSFCGRCHTGVSGRNRIEKDALTVEQKESEGREVMGESGVLRSQGSSDNFLWQGAKQK